MKKAKFGMLISNSNQKLPNGRYSKTYEIKKNISVFCPEYNHVSAFRWFSILRSVGC